jgi:hypothetical protein
LEEIVIFKRFRELILACLEAVGSHAARFFACGASEERLSFGNNMLSDLTIRELPR